MGRIQSSVGLVTGVAIEDTVNQLMALNGQPRDRLISRNGLLEQEQVAVTELMSLVVGVQLTTDRLGQDSLFEATTVTSNNAIALAARSTGSPRAGNYSFVPFRQAQSQQLSSSVFASSDQTLSAGEVVIHTGGFLDESASLDSFNAGGGVARGFIRITDRSGTSADIDLRFAQTANDVVNAINSSSEIGIVASVQGDQFELTDITGDKGHLEVDEVAGGLTARDLGLAGISEKSDTVTGTAVRALHENIGLSTLRDGRGFDIPTSGDALQFDLQDGTSVNFSTSLASNTASLGQLIDEINTAGAGKIDARLSASGNSIEVEDLTVGGGTFAVSSPNGDLAEQLGLDNTAVGNLVTGDRLLAGLDDVLLSSLGGGSGLGTLGQITITDRSGSSDTVDLSSAVTLNEAIDLINATSADVVARLNRTNTGIEIVDTSGSTANPLILADADATNTATALQVVGSHSADSVDSGSLNRQFITRNTQLDEFNQGRGVVQGSIQFTDTAGVSATLNLGSATTTIGDVIDEINDLGLGIQASINETGDGILLVDTASGSNSLVVTDTSGGSAAEQLGIAGTGATINVNGSNVTGIDGATTVRITTTATTTIADLAESINALTGGPASASLLNVNTTGGVRLLLNSASTGERGRVAVSGDVGITFSETAEARDALLAFGANESSGGVLVSSATNTFTGLVEDIEFTIESSSQTPVTVTVAENQNTITDQIDTFVTQYNSLRDRYEELTVFDELTQSVGILFGKSSALRVDFAFGRFLSGRIAGAGSIKSLGQVGLSLNETGKLEFDKTKFSQAYAENAEAIKEFFTTEDTGFSARAKTVADSLAGVEGGALLTRSNTIATQIDQNNDRIATLDIRLDRQRTRLLTQFYNMELTISRLQQNLSALNQLSIIPPLSAGSSS